MCHERRKRLGTIWQRVARLALPQWIVTRIATMASSHTQFPPTCQCAAGAQTRARGEQCRSQAHDDGEVTADA